jgi:hypothetical protein
MAAVNLDWLFDDWFIFDWLFADRQKTVYKKMLNFHLPKNQHFSLSYSFARTGISAPCKISPILAKIDFSPKIFKKH